MTPVASFQRPFDPSAARAHAARDLRHGCPRHARAPWARARGVGALRSARLVRNPRPRVFARAPRDGGYARHARVVRHARCALHAARARTLWGRGRQGVRPASTCVPIHLRFRRAPPAARRRSPLARRTARFLFVITSRAGSMRGSFYHAPGLVLLALVHAAVATSPSPTPPLAHFPLASNGDISSSDGAYTCTEMGAPTWSNSENAVYFDGDDCLSCGVDVYQDITGDSDRTVCLWVMPDGDGQSRRVLARSRARANVIRS